MRRAGGLALAVPAALAALITCGPVAGWAEAPASSLLPRARPGLATHMARLTRAALGGASLAPALSPRPAGRSPRAYYRATSGRVATAPPTPQPASPARIYGTRSVPPVEAEGRGYLCGERAIQGARIATITSPVSGCGIAAPVRVTAVSGLRLTQPAVINCTTARALNSWVKSGLKPAVGRRGGGPVALIVMASYSCRTRNNRPGARISEHARGNAVDIGGVVLGDGRKVTVLKDFRNTRWLRAAYGAACGIFGTTIGPNSDRYHQNHFHFDTAHYRGGPYCR